MILLPLLLAAQHADRSTDRLPPADPLPLDEAAPAAVLAPVQQLLAGAADPQTVAALTLPDGGATIVTEEGPGSATGPVVRQVPWPAFGRAAGSTARLTDPAVDSSGAVATVWSPYVDQADGRTGGCGVIQASLVHTSAGWRVLTLVRSVRRSGCDGSGAAAVRR